MSNYKVLGGSAIPVKVATSEKHIGGPAKPVYLVKQEDGYKVQGGPAINTVLITDPGYPVEGGTAIPITYIPPSGLPMEDGGPAIPISCLNVVDLVAMMGGGAAASVVSIYDRIMATQSAKLLAYLPLNDASGTTAVNKAPGRSGINIVKDPSFEIAGAGGADVFKLWTETKGTGSIARDAGSHTGGYAAKLTSVGGNVDVGSYSMPVIEGATYTYSVWTHGDGTVAARLRVLRGDLGAYLVDASSGNATTDYAHYTTTFIPPPGYGSVIILQFRLAATGSVWIDDVSVSCNSVDATIFNGAYVSATLAQPGLSGLSIALNGSRQLVDVSRAAYANSFPALAPAGSYVIYGKTTLAALTDGVARWLMKFKTPLPFNYVDCFKDANNNKIGWQFDDDGNETFYAITDWNTASWFSLGATWSIANGYKQHLNGVQVGNAAAINGARTSPFDYLGLVLGSEYSAGTASSDWIGNLQHFGLWDTELTAAEMLAVGKY